MQLALCGLLVCFLNIYYMFVYQVNLSFRFSNVEVGKESDFELEDDAIDPGANAMITSAD